MSGIMQLVMGSAGTFVKLSDRSEFDSHVVASGTARAECSYVITDTGVFRCNRQISPDVIYSGEWLIAGNPLDYEVRFTGTGWTSGTLNTWQNLTTFRSVSVEVTQSVVGETTLNASGTIEIRLASSGVILDSCNILAEVTAVVG